MRLVSPAAVALTLAALASTPSYEVACPADDAPAVRAELDAPLKPLEWMLGEWEGRTVRDEAHDPRDDEPVGGLHRPWHYLPPPVRIQASDDGKTLRIRYQFQRGGGPSPFRVVGKLTEDVAWTPEANAYVGSFTSESTFVSQEYASAGTRTYKLHDAARDSLKGEITGEWTRGLAKSEHTRPYRMTCDFECVRAGQDAMTIRLTNICVWDLSGKDGKMAEPKFRLEFSLTRKTK